MRINFGRLFEIYTHISNKLVGILLRARKYGLVDFEGETLFQGRDNGVSVYLLHTRLFVIFKHVANHWSPGQK